MSGFTHRIEHSDEGVIAHVSGDIDLATASDLEEAIREARGSSNGELVVDMSGVTFLDSSGLRAVMAANQEAADDEQRLVIRRPSDAVTRVLEITGLESSLHIEP